MKPHPLIQLWRVQQQPTRAPRGSITPLPNYKIWYTFSFFSWLYKEQILVKYFWWKGGDRLTSVNWSTDGALYSLPPLHTSSSPEQQLVVDAVQPTITRNLKGIVNRFFFFPFFYFFIRSRKEIVCSVYRPPWGWGGRKGGACYWNLKIPPNIIIII